MKPDLPPEARKVESLLLKVRWELINNSQNRKDIKIKHSSIYLAGKVFARVINGEVLKEHHAEGTSPVANNQSTSNTEMDN